MLNFDDSLKGFVVKEDPKKDICFKFEAREEVSLDEEDLEIHLNI